MSNSPALPRRSSEHLMRIDPARPVAGLKIRHNWTALPIGGSVESPDPNEEEQRRADPEGDASTRSFGFTAAHRIVRCVGRCLHLALPLLIGCLV